MCEMEEFIMMEKIVIYDNRRGYGKDDSKKESNDNQLIFTKQSSLAQGLNRVFC